jgi:hypothetical protein
VKRNRGSEDQSSDVEGVDSQGSSKKILNESQGFGSQPQQNPIALTLEGSQSELPPGSQVLDSEMGIVGDLVDGIREVLAAALQPQIQRHNSVLEGQSETTIEYALLAPGMLNSTVENPVQQDRREDQVMETHSTADDEFVEEKAEEKVAEVAEKAEMEDIQEAEQVVEMEFDEDTSHYLEGAAERIFQGALMELLGRVVQQAKAESTEFAEYPSDRLRSDILENPGISRLLDKVRSETEDGLQAEILRLLGIDDMVET